VNRDETSLRSEEEGSTVKWPRALFDRRNRRRSPTVAVSIRKEAGNLYVLALSGVLTKTAANRIQAIAEQDLARGARGVNVLLILNGLRGWQRDEAWGDTGFFARCGDAIGRIAVEGGAQWKEQVLGLLRTGHPRDEVRFFTSEQEPRARAWLTEGQAW
jgi:hypothetical protein